MPAIEMMIVNVFLFPGAPQPLQSLQPLQPHTGQNRWATPDKIKFPM